MTTWKQTGRKRMRTLHRFIRAPLVVVQIEEEHRYTAWYVNSLTSTVSEGTEAEYRWRDARPDDLMPSVVGDVNPVVITSPTDDST